MIARSSLTWRTFGLSLVGLCLACAHAALAGPTPRMRTASGAGTAAAPSRPSTTPDGGDRGSRGWRGVGVTTIAVGPGPGDGALRHATAEALLDPPIQVCTAAEGAPPEAPVPAALTQRQRAASQMLRIEASRNLRPAVPVDRVALARPAPAVAAPAVAAPTRQRDPRVAAALRPLASAPMLARDVFGGR